MTEVVAALDCGSNSTRLLIQNDAGEAQRREMRITRLGQGVDKAGQLVADAMARSFEVLSQYRTYMDEANVSRGLLVATSAVRDAKNGEDFLHAAHEITGIACQVLTGQQEATYSYEGATTGLEHDERVTVILDIGGGSTELAMMRGGVLHSFSMQLGCVRVTERSLGSDVVTPERAAATRAMIEDELQRAFGAEPSFDVVAGNVRLVGLAGTVATLAQLDAGLTTYDRDAVHHRLLSRSTVRYWRDLLADETPAERLAHPGMVVGREDVLVAGLYVLDAVMDRLKVDELLTSENDILDGIVESLLRS